MIEITTLTRALVAATAYHNDHDTKNDARPVRGADAQSSSGATPAHRPHGTQVTADLEELVGV